MLRKWLSSLQLARDVWRRKLGILLFDKRNIDSVELILPLKKIVLVRWDAKWGDSIVSSFVFREWRKAYPDIEINVITTPHMAELFKNHFGANNVYKINKRPSYEELKKLSVKVGEVDLLVHFSKTLKMKDLYFMSKVQADIIAGLDDNINLINMKLGKLSENKHFSEKYRFLLESTGVSVGDTSYIIPNDNESQSNVDNFLSSYQSPILAFNPYGSGNSRRLNNDAIRDILKIITDVKPIFTVVMLVTPDDKLEISTICENYKNVVYYEESASIYDSIAIIKRSDFVISVDTATVHIATGLNKKTLAIYNTGEENYNEWHPNNKMSTAIFAQESYPEDINLLDLDELKFRINSLNLSGFSNVYGSD